MKRKLWYFHVLVGYSYIADGVVLAETKEEAENIVKQKYDNPYEKVEISTDDNGSDGVKEDSEIDGLFVRWED